MCGNSSQTMDEERVKVSVAPGIVVVKQKRVDPFECLKDKRLDFKQHFSAIIASLCLLWQTMDALDAEDEIAVAIEVEVSRILTIPAVEQESRYIDSDIMTDLKKHPWERRIPSTAVLDRLDAAIPRDEKDGFLGRLKDLVLVRDCTYSAVKRRKLQPVEDYVVDNMCRVVTGRLGVAYEYRVTEQTSTLYKQIFDLHVNN